MARKDGQRQQAQMRLDAGACSGEEIVEHGFQRQHGWTGINRARHRGQGAHLATRLARFHQRHVEARCGRLPLADACKLSYLLSNIAKVHEAAELEARVEALEADANSAQSN